MPATDVAPPMFIGGWWVDVVLVDVAVDMTYPMFAVRRGRGGRPCLRCHLPVIAGRVTRRITYAFAVYISVQVAVDINSVR
jgi:hypothetical protein